MTNPGDDDGSDSLSRNFSRTPNNSEVRRDLPSGYQLAGRFTIQHKLGEGGMGHVFSAFDHTRQISVALKVLGILTPESIAALKREFRVAAGMVHPNLVRLHELFSDAGDWFFTMDLLHGETITALRGPGKPLGHSIGRQIFGQLAQALNDLHDSGSLHGDLKPANFLLVGDHLQVVLLDFGLARTLGARTQEMLFAGTPRYMAPEQALGDTLAESADWYSFGVVLLEALAGSMPSRYAALAECDKLPGEFSALCRELLQVNPASRPSGAEVLRTIGVNPSEPPPGSERLRTSPKLIGRDKELARLQGAYAQCVEGNVQVVLIRGESGIGKTALVEHFVDTARSSGATVISGRCRERESVSYKALDGLVDNVVSYLDGLPSQAARDLLPQNLAELTRLFPTLRMAAVVAEISADTSKEYDQSSLKQRAITAFRDLFAALRLKAPLILWIDDLQWSDSYSATLLKPLLAGETAIPLLLIGSLRKSGKLRGAMLDSLFGANSLGLPEPVILDLAPLEHSDSVKLAARLLDDTRGLPKEEQAERIANEAGGHPQFIAELAHCRSAIASDQLPKPRALSQLIRSRIEALPDNARRLLELMSLAGTPVSKEVAIRAHNLAPDGLEVALDILRATRLALSRGMAPQHEVEILHDRIREIVVRTMTQLQQRAHHKDLARAFQSEPGTSPEVLAAHFHAAGDTQQAGIQWIRAGDEAFEALAFQRATELYQRAMDISGMNAETLYAISVRKAESLAYAGQAVASAEQYLEAATLPAAASVELRRRAAEQLLLAGHLKHGLEVIEVVLAALRMPKTAGGVRALISIAFGRLRIRARGLRVHQRQEAQISPRDLAMLDASWSIACSLGMIDFMRGAAFQNHHLLMALRAGEPRRLLRALTLEISYAAAPGRSSSRRMHSILAMANELAESLDDPVATALVGVSKGVAAYLTGQFEQAHEECSRAVKVLRQYKGTAWETVTAQRFMVISLFFLGRVRELGRLVPPLLGEFSSSGNLYASTYFQSSYSTVAWLVHDDADSASRELQSARINWTAPGIQVPHYWLLQGQFHLDLYTNDVTSLWDKVQTAWPELKKAQLLRIGAIRVQLLHMRSMAALAAGQAKRADGKPAEALALFHEAKRCTARLRREKLRTAAPLGQLLDAAVAYALQDRKRAVASLKRCLPLLEAQQMHGYLAAARMRLGAIVGEEQGRELAEQGKQALQSEGIANIDRFTRILAPQFVD